MPQTARYLAVVWRWRKASTMTSAPAPLLPAAPRGMRRLLLATTALATLLASPATAQDLPTNGQVVAGAASIQTAGQDMTVTTATQRTVIDWNSFSVAADHRLTFNQPDAASIAVNRVIGADPSKIFGTITSNGRVVIAIPTASGSIPLRASTSRAWWPARGGSATRRWAASCVAGRSRSMRATRAPRSSTTASSPRATAGSRHWSRPACATPARSPRGWAAWHSPPDGRRPSISTATASSTWRSAAWPTARRSTVRSSTAAASMQRAGRSG
ncbi:two-partner secretion domain-containing protein [Sphingomonas adhaesiva]|uniref:two-partner secretion domain-containing protein n=1 Tax=Sphingomonas adhaesiva TaxID=28212 RepID=UPI003FA739EB